MNKNYWSNNLRTEATDKVVKKLSKKIGADKIMAKMKEAEKVLEGSKSNCMLTFFEKKNKKKKKDLDYRFRRDEDTMTG